jgi:hypothetical protein
MEYNYSITTSYDGELVNTLRVSDMLEAVDAWNKCVDFGDAKEYATYNLSDPTGKMYTKNFYRNGVVNGK